MGLSQSCAFRGGNSIASISQSSGFTFGQQDVTIGLKNPATVTGVSLNGQAVLYYDQVDSTHVHVYTGATASAGLGNVVVSTTGGSVVGANVWTYVFWTPGSFDDAAATTHAPTFLVDETNITNNGTVCSAWPDQSGAGLLTPTAAGAAQPGYSAAGGPTGNACTTYSGTLQAFDCGAGTPSSTKYFCALVVFKPTAGTFNSYQFLFGKQNSVFNWAISGDPSAGHTLAAWGSTGSAIFAQSRLRLDDGAWHWALMIWDGTSMSGSQGTVRLIVDGEVQISRRSPAAAVLPTSTDHVGIGGAIPTTPGFLFTGSMTMVCSWDALPGRVALAGITDLMSRKYGLTSNPVLHSTAPGVGALGAGDYGAIVDSHGNLDVEIGLTPTVVTDSTTQGSGWIWQGALNAGNTGVQYDASTDKWFSIVNGTTVLTIDPAASAGGPFYIAGDTLKVRQIYAPAGVGLENALIFTNNGKVTRFAGAAASGGALSAASAATLGSAIGGGSAFGSSTGTLVCRSSLANTTLEGKIEGLLVGDSLTRRETLLASSDRYFYTAAEAASRLGVRSIAVPNTKLNDQQAIFESDFVEGDPTVQWIDVEDGTNECWTFAQTEATIATAWNAAYSRFKTSNPKAKVIAEGIPPYATTGGQAAGYAVWKTVLSDMGVPGYAGGSHPISGWDYLNSIMTTGALNDGTDTLAAAYTSGGGPPHFNDAGCAVCSGYKHAAVRAQGLI